MGSQICSARCHGSWCKRLVGCGQKFRVFTMTNQGCCTRLGLMRKQPQWGLALEWRTRSSCYSWPKCSFTVSYHAVGCRWKWRGRRPRLRQRAQIKKGHFDVARVPWSGVWSQTLGYCGWKSVNEPNYHWWLATPVATGLALTTAISTTIRIIVVGSYFPRCLAVIVPAKLWHLSATIGPQTTSDILIAWT